MPYSAQTRTTSLLRRTPLLQISTCSRCIIGTSARRCLPCSTRSRPWCLDTNTPRSSTIRCMDDSSTTANMLPCSRVSRRKEDRLLRCRNNVRPCYNAGDRYCMLEGEMPSPFPGMDPYLEGYLWPDAHNALALSDPLPTIPVPLRQPDDDVLLDLAE